ncbi:nuclease-related domain-containing protein [Streptomyces sp. NPDC050263]|uniref:nuclease-related domain-containing protein n=1 Tax=Streptomyces sp. NPDC050263 TaxID=3155037 RepID=UPI003432CA36
MNYTCHLLLLLALLALVVDPGPRLRIPARIRSWLRSRRHPVGAGASAAARARRLRTPAVRVADRLGIPTQRGSEAARWAAGAEGERRTARRLRELESEGWTVLHDRALPGSRANLDHLAVSWSGVVFVVDTKRWSAHWPVSVRDGRLFHGDRDVTDRLDGVRHEADAVAKTLRHRFRVIPVVLVDGPSCDGRPLLLDDIHIVPASEACLQLRILARIRPAYDGDVVGRAVRELFPPYGRRGDR